MPIAIETSVPATLPVVRKQRAPTVVGPTTPIPMRPTNKLPQDLLDTARACPTETFDAEKHLCFQAPERRYTMEEWGYGGQGISPIASCSPFPLWTEGAVQQVRREIFSESVMGNCQYASAFAKNMIRGYTQEQAPFTWDIWRSEKLRQAVSSVAGIDLVHAFDYEIGNVNIFVGDGEETSPEKGGGNVGFSWHYDSYPFVCIVMLSDCSQMIGGETAVRTGSGEIIKTRGPTMGTAVILQGRYIQHAALAAIGKERISIITPFRPRDPLVRDEILLTGSRPISDQARLVSDYCHYRAELLAARFTIQAKALKEAEKKGEKIDVDAAKEFIEEQMEFLQATLDELRPIQATIEQCWQV